MCALTLFSPQVLSVFPCLSSFIALSKSSTKFCDEFIFLSYVLLLLLLLLLLSSLVKGLFFLVLLLNQRWFPPLRLQVSHCSTFRITCDVPSMAVFCSESIERFPDTASKFFFRLLVTIPVAPIITGIIVHFRFHIRCISIHKLLYFNFIIIIIIIIQWHTRGRS